MRPPIRPFVTVHKHRLLNSRASRPLPNSNAQNAAPGPSLDDPNILTTSLTELDAAYTAALEAADAIFGGKAVERPVMPPPPKTTGRVLPDLLQQEALASLQETPAPQKRRAPPTPKAAKPTPIKPKKSSSPPASSPPVRKHQAEERQPEVAPELSRHAVSAIQRRWVFKTELKAGEKWKRRLRKVAR